MGKVFGVEVRLHTFFLFILVPTALWARILGHSGGRGVLMWGCVLVAVMVREIARAIAAAWFYLEVKTVLLLPTGGVLTYAGDGAEQRAGERTVERAMALVGPVTNVVLGLALAGLVLTVSPEVDLVSRPWVSPLHLLRTLVWVNFLLAAVNLLPVWPLDGGRMAKAEIARQGGLPAGVLQERFRLLSRMGWALGTTLILVGLVGLNWWVIMAGMGVLLAVQVDRHGLWVERTTDPTKVADVMLTEYAVLPASATLEDAMARARHSLQDDFPVVRAGNLVGAVERRKIVEALTSTGNGYVQGIMTRSFHTAKADELLVDVLKRAMAQGPGLQMMPVLDGDAVIGLLTPQHLKRSLGLIPRRLVRRTSTATEDETP